MMTKLTKICALLLICFYGHAWAESVRLPVTQDNSIVMVDGEWSANAGSSARLRIKGNQHIVAMSFDVSAIRGRSIKSAELVAYPAAESIAGVSISTIAAAWKENDSSGLSAGIAGLNGWGYAGGRFPGAGWWQFFYARTSKRHTRCATGSTIGLCQPTWSRRWPLAWPLV